MGNFTNDLQLLKELQDLIDENKKIAAMDKTTEKLVGASSFVMKMMIPSTKKKSAHQADVLTRARDRLKELM